MNLKISVIIPVYNAEKTLHRCVDSRPLKRQFPTNNQYISD